MRCAPLPPRASGHPTAWASSPSTSPNDALSGCPSRSIEWAASPANSARAAGSRNARRARDVAGSSAGSPNLASSSGCLGGRTTGARSSGTSRSHSRTSGPNRRRQAAASAPSASPRAVEVPLEHDAPRGGQGVRERRFRLDPLEAVARQVQRPEERRRDAQRVDRRAGVVDEAGQRQLRRSACRPRRSPPPRRRGPERPARASSIAAASPLGPAPTTIASRPSPLRPGRITPQLPPRGPARSARRQSPATDPAGRSSCRRPGRRFTTAMMTPARNRNVTGRTRTRRSAAIPRG